MLLYPCYGKHMLIGKLDPSSADFPLRNKAEQKLASGLLLSQEIAVSQEIAYLNVDPPRALW